jgi:ABC-type Zn uptake system ZnuABC Zn-binding protein ZnuA
MARGRARIVTRLAALGLGAIPLTAAPQAADDSIVVAAALPITHSIASALAEGTRIEVRLVPEGGRRMGQLPSYFARQADTLAEDLADTDAVVTIGKLWSDDPLYTVARTANIRVVDIDATKPWSLSLEGIAVAEEPVNNARWAGEAAPASSERAPSPYFWQSPANGARAAEIVARDLARLVPEASARVAQNLTQFRADMLELQTEFELKLAELPDLTVAALASELVYLTNDFGIYVDSYFLKQDIDWTEDDLAALTRYLSDEAIGVVIHKWEPDERIAAAIEAADAELAVLDPIDLGIEQDDGAAADSYQRLLRANLETLYSALAAANR